MPEERRETFLVVRDRETLEVVTVLETLSPANKRAGGDGRREYLIKRDTVLQTATHLVGGRARSGPAESFAPP
jgi:hypothetical protein